MRVVRSALIALIAVALAVTTVGYTPVAQANDDQVQNCPVGFELSEDQRACIKTTSPITPDAVCPQGAAGQPDSCYVVQPRDAAGAATCADASTPGANGCLVETQQAEPTCLPSAMLVPGTNSCSTPISASQACPNQGTPPACVQQFTSTAEQCVLGMLLQSRCVEGEFATAPLFLCRNNGTPFNSQGGVFCVVNNLGPAIVGPAPCPTGTATAVIGDCASPEASIATCTEGPAPVNGQCQRLSDAVPVCPDGFEQRGTECARFEPATTTFMCRETATDIDGECRRSVPSEGGEPTCADPAATLIEGDCLQRVRAARAPAVRYTGPFKNMPTTPRGLFDPVDVTAREEPQTRAEAPQERREDRAAARAANGGLAVTGSTSDSTAAIAFILLGSGCGVVGSLRRRKITIAD